MKSLKFLESYINAYSPVGEEWEGQKVWIDYVKSYADDIQVDGYGNAIAIYKSKSNPDKKKVVLEAHCDEISYQISYIQSDGLIRVSRNGGSDPVLAPSKKVVIHTRKNGMVKGVFGFPAIHTRKTSTEKSVKVEDLFIDIGLDKREDVIAAGVEVGNNVNFDEVFSMIGDYYVGKSLDNKMGGYIIASVLRKLHKENIDLPFDLYVTNSVTEEIGLLGAGMTAYNLKPDCAFVVDVCHHTHTPGISKVVEGDVKSGSGGAIEYSAQNHRKLIDLVRDISDKNKIPYQLCIGSRGNDTMSFYKYGIPTMIIGIPQKYMHSSNEFCHKKDVKNIINMFYESLMNLKLEEIKYH